MHSLNIIRILVGMALASVAFSAAALGMGRLTVLSSLGHPLNVEIELISVTKEERGTLSAKLGTASDYERSNLHIGAAGGGSIRVSIEQRTNGVPYLRVTSAKPINEPFVNLLIELTSQSGPITRQFAVLLDPPEITPARSLEPDTPPPTAPTETSSAPTPTRVTDGDASAQYGPVRRGETLSRIAAKVRPRNASLQQTMLAIFRNNPSAFINNNMNLLKEGHRLRIPAPDQVSAAPTAESAQTAQTQTGVSVPNRADVAAEESKTKPRPPISESRPAAAAKKGDGGKPVVRLSRGAAPGKSSSVEERLRMLEEDLAARERALNDANERIKRLEKAAAGAPAATGDRQK